MIPDDGVVGKIIMELMSSETIIPEMIIIETPLSWDEYHDYLTPTRTNILWDGREIELTQLSVHNMGKYDRAGAHLERLLNTTSGLERASYIPRAAYVARKRGNEEKASELIRKAEAIQKGIESEKVDLPEQINLSRFLFWKAEVLTLQEEKEAAIDVLRKLYRRGYRDYYHLDKRSAIFQELQGHPEFEQLMKEMKEDVDQMKENVVREQGKIKN